VTEARDTAAEMVRLEHELTHYRSELRVVTDPRDRKVLIEVIAEIEARLGALQAAQRASRPT
jgi:uncharacterized membrane protein YccC